MFFDLILLNPQHRGRFGLAWIAATRGPKHLSKKQIKEVSIVQLCDELQQFIQTESRAVKNRFSLRLSTILVNGAVKIFRQQVIILQEDLFSFFSTIRIPANIGALPGSLEEETGIFESPPTPVVKVKRKRQKPILETPPQLLNLSAGEVRTERPSGTELQGPIEEVLQARQDDISIREPLPRELEMPDDIRDKELGELGVLGDDEMQLLIKQIERQSVDIEARPSITTEGTVELPQFDPQPVQPASTPSSENPPQSFIVVAQVHAPKDLESEKPPEVKETIIAPLPEEVEDVVEKAVEPPPVDVVDKEKERPVHAERGEKILEKEIEIPEELEAPLLPQERSRLLKEIQLQEVKHKKGVKKGARVKEQQGIPQEHLMYATRRPIAKINRCIHVANDVFVPRPDVPSFTLTRQLILGELLFWVDEEIEDIERVREDTRGSSLRPSSISATHKTPSSATPPIIQYTPAESSQSDIHMTRGVSFKTPSFVGEVAPPSVSVTDVSEVPQPRPSDVGAKEIRDVEVPAKRLITSTPKLRKKKLPMEEILVQEVTTEEILPPAAKRLRVSQPEEITEIAPEPVLAEKVPEVLPEIPEPEVVLPVTEPEFPTELPVPTEPQVVGLQESSVPQIELAEIAPVIEEPAYLTEKERAKPEVPVGDMDKERHRKIVDFILNWEPSQGDITIELIAEKPINRLHIARAFNDVLVLCKKGYVILISEEDSIELKSIEKGPKLLN